MQTNTSTITHTAPQPKSFPLGQIVATPGALEAIAEASQRVGEFIQRHARLEQGELCEAVHKENLFSVDKRLRIFSSFKTDLDVKLWVITEADRSATTILLPSEYQQPAESGAVNFCREGRPARCTTKGETNHHAEKE